MTLPPVVLYSAACLGVIETASPQSLPNLSVNGPALFRSPKVPDMKPVFREQNLVKRPLLVAPAVYRTILIVAGAG